MGTAHQSVAPSDKYHEKRPENLQIVQYFKEGPTDFHLGKEKEQCYIKEEDKNKCWWQLCWFIAFFKK